jgi:hypothetical protein
VVTRKAVTPQNTAPANIKSVQLKCYENTECVSCAALVTMMMVHVGSKHVGDCTNVYREVNQSLLVIPTKYT